MIWFNTIFQIPPSVTDEEDIPYEFERTFEGKAILPSTGIMPMSNGNGGANLVSCLLPFDYQTASELLEASGNGWNCWAYQSMDGSIVDVPVKQNLVKHFLPDSDINGLHLFSGQAAWVLD